MVDGEAVYSSKAHSYRHSSVQEHYTDGTRLDSTAAVLHSRDTGLWSCHIWGAGFLQLKEQLYHQLERLQALGSAIQARSGLTNTRSSVLSCQP